MACCSQFQATRGGDSPFLKNIVLGYYDGPTSGLVRCNECGTDYEYDLLAWDGTQDSRVFALRQLPQGSFDKLEELLTIAGPPRYPDWVILRNAALEERWQQIDRLLEEISQTTTKVEYLVFGATLTGGIRVRRVDDTIEQKIVQRALPADEIGSINAWYKYFSP